MDHLSTLPSELKTLLVEHLNTVDIFALSRVSRTFNDHVKSCPPRIWHHLEFQTPSSHRASPMLIDGSLIIRCIDLADESLQSLTLRHCDQSAILRALTHARETNASSLRELTLENQKHGGNCPARCWDEGSSIVEDFAERCAEILDDFEVLERLVVYNADILIADTDFNPSRLDHGPVQLPDTLSHISIRDNGIAAELSPWYSMFIARGLKSLELWTNETSDERPEVLLDEFATSTKMRLKQLSFKGFFVSQMYDGSLDGLEQLHLEHAEVTGTLVPPLSLHTVRFLNVEVPVETMQTWREMYLPNLEHLIDVHDDRTILDSPKEWFRMLNRKNANAELALTECKPLKTLKFSHRGRRLNRLPIVGLRRLLHRRGRYLTRLAIYGADIDRYRDRDTNVPVLYTIGSQCTILEKLTVCVVSMASLSNLTELVQQRSPTLKILVIKITDLSNGSKFDALRLTCQQHGVEFRLKQEVFDELVEESGSEDSSSDNEEI